MAISALMAGMVRIVRLVRRHRAVRAGLPVASVVSGSMRAMSMQAHPATVPAAVLRVWRALKMAPMAHIRVITTFNRSLADRAAAGELLTRINTAKTAEA